jgi:hypothetical protein
MDEAIAAAFASGALVRPAPGEPDLVHLSRALALHAGVERFQPAGAVERRLLELMAPLGHVVFVLLDGLGMNLLERMPEESFFRRHLRRRILATSPSTTACALTGIATGEWASEHAVTGWFTQVPEYGLTMTTLPLVERFSGRSLAEQGLGAYELFPLRAYHAEMSASVLTLLPRPIANTAFARYSRAETLGEPYESLAEARDKAVEHVRSAGAASHTYLYVPDVDTACHHHGVESDEALHLLLGIDGELSRLAGALRGRATLVISADHGLIDVPPAGHLSLTPGDSMLELLEAPPSGDARLPIFHVRQGYTEELARAFAARFGQAIRLLPSAEADRIRLFGPRPMSKIARSRFGDFVGIALAPCSLHYRTAPPGGAAQRVYVAQHAGLSPEEMYIPLIVA